MKQMTIEQMDKARSIALACYSGMEAMPSEAQVRLCASAAKRLRLRSKECAAAKSHQLADEYAFAAKMLAANAKAHRFGMTGKTTAEILART